MQNAKGFTLLEIMIVVVIAVSVAAFAVPAYKKAQDRNRYLAAQGVLIDLGNGIKMLREALSTGIMDRIMLDNFTPERTVGAVKIIRDWSAQNNKYVEIESSGGITIETLHDYAVTGVDFASVGALTHSYKSLDMSFKAVK